MDDFLPILIIIAILVLVSEIGGFLIIRLSHRHPNSFYINKYGKLFMIIGIATFILGIIWVLSYLYS